jgi:peptidoglycan-associated lipoprotein
MFMRNHSSNHLTILLASLSVCLLLAGCSKKVSSSVGDQSLTAGPQKAEAPKVEAPPEAPKVEAPPEAPKVEAPKVEAPPEAPKVEEAKVEQPAAAPSEAPAPQPAPQQEEVRVTEQAPPPPSAPAPEVAREAPTEAAPAAPAPEPAPEQAKPAELGDVFFDYDRAAIRGDAKPVLEADAALLKAGSDWTLLIAGHCDERGTAEYNLVLGERRAQAAKQYLEDLGIPGGKIQVTSFGKEKPFCSEHSAECWQKNRRAHFSVQ